MNIIEIYKRFPTHTDCLTHLEAIRWPGGPRCPYCGSDNSTPRTKENRHQCNRCNRAYSVTVDTIFHDTKLDLQKWFLAICLILNAKKGISSRQLARDLDVNKNTAWYLAMRIRKAMKETEQRQLLQGVVECDETYLGGKPRKGSGEGPNKRGRGAKKVCVVGVAERDGRIKAKVTKNASQKSLSCFIRENVKADSIVITDEYSGYFTIFSFVNHKTINHSISYADGDIHTNTIESFWSLLKRGIVGQYHKVSVNHLDKYITEFCYRHNHRKNPDMFALTLSRAVGVMQ